MRRRFPFNGERYLSPDYETAENKVEIKIDSAVGSVSIRMIHERNVEMKKVDWRIIVGIVLLVIGVITLLQSLGIMDLQGSTWAVVMGAIFAAAGAVFIYVFLVDRKQWWALIPGCSLIGLAGVSSCR